MYDSLSKFSGAGKLVRLIKTCLDGTKSKVTIGNYLSSSFLIVPFVPFTYEKVKTYKYLGSLLTNQNSIHEEIKCRLEAGNSRYYSVQTLLPSRLLSMNLKIRIYKTIILPLVLYG